jgi:hypothetical protein
MASEEAEAVDKRTLVLAGGAEVHRTIVSGCPQLFFQALKLLAN